MAKKNNKDSVISKCHFKLQQVQSKLNTEKNDIDFDSLNQAFFQMSLKYRPKNKSHACNVYNTFKTDENLLLEYFR